MRTGLAAAADTMFAEDFAGRVLPYDGHAALHYADIVTARRASGTPIDAFDALTASTARVAGAAVATRDSGGFAGCGIALIDPWTNGPAGLDPDPNRTPPLARLIARELGPVGPPPLGTRRSRVRPLRAIPVPPLFPLKDRAPVISPVLSRPPPHGLINA